MALIAKVVVEIALDREFDYGIPPDLAPTVKIGSRVQVPFNRSMARGYVVGLANHSARSDLKSIHSLISPKPLVSETMLKLARWIADYYAATIEQAIRTVLPCAVRRHGARFKEENLVALTDAAREASLLPGLRQSHPKHAAVLEALAAEGPLTPTALARTAGVSASVIQTLKKAGLVSLSLQTTARDPLAGLEILPTQPQTLFPEQVQALQLINQAADTLSPAVVLLHGVTGSGKTEVYLQAIQARLEQGKGAIVLVPEIALTPQTVERFRARFGSAIAVLHSHLSNGERHDEWYRIYEGKARIVVGARSALFAPVDRLGLIIVDEEHEPSYKQSETPRYNARDVAVMRGRMEGCAVVLGSATPALESFYNVRKGKYALAVMAHRVDHRAMPVMRIVDMRQEASKEGRINIFSRELVEAIRARLERAEQTMLFLNRRGFSTSVICPACGYVVKCTQCSVSLTYHKAAEEVRCHICGAASKAPETCPSCSIPTLKFQGVGTQRIESIVRTVFPKARVQRMDADTTTGKHAYDRILGDFKAGRIDILIGTQMIAKGLHFPGVTLVGVVYADLSLHMPDFRAAERTFQLLLQVSGRAGRGDVAGEVIVQTFTPMHPAIQAARRLDYDGFCDQEIESRRELLYPPFAHLVCLTFEGRDEAKTALAALQFGKALKPRLAPAVVLSDAIPAPLSMAKGFYRHQILIRSVTMADVSLALKEALRSFRCPPDIRLAVDVDALSMM